MIQGGTTLGGYRVERQLGVGGMGIVYEATQLSLDRQVALKILRTSLADDEAFATRLRREGRLQAQVEHPHVLDVYEVGESEQGLFLAMRLIEDGTTLAGLLESGELSGRQTLDLLGQAASALDAAHSAGLVHGDVKPQNILVDRDGAAYLADFGLTRAAGDSLTASRALLGTVAYVAPEVIHGETATSASDRYSFAATLFHCLTGDPLYPLGTDAAVMYAHVSSPPPRASERRAELPAAVDEILDAGLAKDPEQRPATATTLVHSVREALGPDRVKALAAPRVGVRSAQVPATTPIEGSATAERPRRRRLGLIAGALLVSAGLGATLAALLLDDNPGAASVPVPQVPAGAQSLGSTLPEPDRSVDCRGRAPAPGSEACAIAQTRLPGAEVVVPADGEVVGWAVRGASGELALDVIRPRGPDTARVSRSQFESAGNAAPHYFHTALAVEAGDVLALELGRGASIGVRDKADAATERWFEPTGGFYGVPDQGEGTGLDDEIMLRADFVPGGSPPQPRQLLGAAAANAAPGTVRKRIPVRISEPPARVEIAAVEIGGRVALDLFRQGQRRARLFVPGLLPGGQPIDLDSYTYAGEPAAELDLWWVNPNSGRLIFRLFGAYSRELELLG
jgi:Protein kinase domain